MQAVHAASQCRHCKEEIRAGAAKCPHCLGWQSKWMLDPQSPRGILVVLGILLLFAVPLLLLTRATLFRDPDQGLDQLVISESEMHHSTVDSGRFVTVVGKLRNTGGESLKNPHFEVQFFNADGKLIDSLASNSYNLIIPARSEVSFKVRGVADRPAREYARYQIRLTGVSRARIF